MLDARPVLCEESAHNRVRGFHAVSGENTKHCGGGGATMILIMLELDPARGQFYSEALFDGCGATADGLDGAPGVVQHSSSSAFLNGQRVLNSG